MTRRTSDRTVGPILAAQPQVRETPVRVFFLGKNLIELLSTSLRQLQDFFKPLCNPTALTHECVGGGSREDGELNRVSCSDVLPPNCVNMGLPQYSVHNSGARDVPRKA
jgi:hypothetical protein